MSKQLTHNELTQLIRFISKDYEPWDIARGFGTTLELDESGWEAQNPKAYALWQKYLTTSQTVSPADVWEMLGCETSVTIPYDVEEVLHQLHSTQSDSSCLVSDWAWGIFDQDGEDVIEDFIHEHSSDPREALLALWKKLIDRYGE